MIFSNQRALPRHSEKGAEEEEAAREIMITCEGKAAGTIYPQAAQREHNGRCDEPVSDQGEVVLYI